MQFVNGLHSEGILTIDYARSASWGYFFGQGFNSPHLHQVKNPNPIKTGLDF